MKSMLAIAVALLVTFIAPPRAVFTEAASTNATAQRDTSAAAREVEQVENGRLASMEKGDVDAVAKVIADDFVVTSADGRNASRSEYLDRLRAASSPRAHLIHDEVQVRVYGDAAVITGRSRSTRNGQELPGQVRYIHVYARRNGAWQMVAMHVTRIAPTP
jgi:ketosteroid isomerase-like protein